MLSDQFARLVGASNRGVEVSFKIELSQMINSSKEVEDFKDKLVMFFAKDNKMVVDLDSLEITSVCRCEHSCQILCFIH